MSKLCYVIFLAKTKFEMVIECNKKEREKLFSQSNGALLPG